MARRTKPVIPAVTPGARPPRRWGRRRARRGLPSPTSVGVDMLAHSRPLPDDAGPRVVGTGEVAFQRIVERIRSATRSVDIRAFLWRDDDAGNLLGEAVLRAAERGAQVRIHKDRIAAVYEYAGGNKQSFFHKRVNPVHGVQAWFLGAVFRAKGSFRQRPNALSQAVLAHPNIKVEHLRNRFDHSKVYVVDDEWMCLGSMGIGDNHRHDWVDLMVELDGADHVARLRQRMAGDDEFDPSRGLDFLVHSRSAHRPKTCPMLTHRLGLIDSAKTALTVEMAYLGDVRFTRALVRAIERGVAVTLVTAARADVLGNSNRSTCETLRRLTGGPDHLRIVVLPRMVHSKAVVIDHRWVDIGSANFTRLSHGVYDEINLYADHAPFARALEAEIARHAEEGEIIAGKLALKAVRTQLERAIVAFQSRKGG
ncbi:MAG: phosphatidylserine/phosphatidylglycerophosphate/cardiolipin synthase family protein [Myxococcales bacterium]|nr:phosphatidylserine/phosphatidylglycerophosphate/cardiolipin synthase family protein [Myxococcales bacterium]